MRCFCPWWRWPIIWRPGRLQNAVLLLSSCLFYGFGLGGHPLSAAVLALHVLFTYLMARRIGAAKGARKKRLMALAVVSVATVLAVFKYYNALVPTLLGAAGGGLVRLAFPLGISFYTFATISYLVDVARGDHGAGDRLCRLRGFRHLFRHHHQRPHLPGAEAAAPAAPAPPLGRPARRRRAAPDPVRALQMGGRRQCAGPLRQPGLRERGRLPGADPDLCGPALCAAALL